MERDRNGRGRILMGLMAVAALLFALTGCGGGPEVYSSEVPEGYALIRDVRHGYFLAPEKEGTIAITSFDGPLSADETYVLRDEDHWILVCLNRRLLVCQRMEGGPDVPTSLREMERSSGVRLTLTGLVAGRRDPDTEIGKAIYQAEAQALFDDEYYGIFSGFAAVISFGEERYILFSGTPTGSGADMVPVTSFLIKPYDLTRNASSPDDMEDLSGYEGPVGAGEFGRARVWYKGTTVHVRDILVRCTGAGLLKRGEEHLTVRALGGGPPPAPPYGHVWAWADIEEEYGSTDIRNARPALSLRAETAEGEAAGRPYTVLKEGSRRRILFTVPEGTGEVRILAGLDGLVMNVSLS